MSRAAARRLVAVAVAVAASCGRRAPRTGDADARQVTSVIDAAPPPGDAAEVPFASAPGLVTPPAFVTTPLPPWPDDVGPRCPAGYRDLARNCAVCETGAVACWGLWNSLVFRGKASTRERDVVTLPDLPPVAAIRVGEPFACVVSEAGAVACWGDVVAPSLRRDRDDNLELVTIATPSATVQLEAGGSSACARGRDGEVTCWGRNDYGQLGHAVATGEPGERPSVIPDLRAKALAVGPTNAFAIDRGGQVWSWGAPPGGGDAHLTGFTPTRVRGLTDATAIATDGLETCALRADGELWCWGVACADAPQGADLATARRARAARPRRIAAAPWAVQLAVGYDGAIAVDADGNAFTFDARGARRRIVGLPPVRTVTTGWCAACAILRTGELRCWGENRGAQTVIAVREPAGDAAP